jgi:ribonuclease HII
MSARFDPALLPPTPDLSFERSLWAAGVSRVAGIDEAGRGPLAGPVAAAVVVLPPRAEVAAQLAGIRDSKQMTPAQRLAACPRIRTVALAVAVGFAEAAEIDVLGILPATRLAACRALQALELPPEHLLLDYLFLPDLELPQTSLIKGDRRSLSIAAASVLAKTARDARLVRLDEEYPGYGFARHKGYGTAAHRAALRRLGPCPQHRMSFRLG